jgi:hypothetical protein
VRWVCPVAVATACYAPHPQPGQPCTTTPCADGLTCIAGICAAPGDASDAAVTAVRLEQQGSAFLGQATTLTIDLPNAPRAGDLLVFTGAGNSDSLASVTGGGTTWSLAARSDANANVEIWYGITDGSSATVTIALPTNNSPMWGVVSEWSGMATVNVMDGAAATSGLNSPASAGGITTQNAHDLIVFAVADGTPNTFGDPAPGAWTALDSIDRQQLVQHAWYQVVTTATAYDPAVSETNGGWDAAVAALRAAN